MCFCLTNVQTLNRIMSANLLKCGLRAATVTRHRIVTSANNCNNVLWTPNVTATCSNSGLRRQFSSRSSNHAHYSVLTDGTVSRTWTMESVRGRELSDYRANIDVTIINIEWLFICSSYSQFTCNQRL